MGNMPQQETHTFLPYTAAQSGTSGTAWSNYTNVCVSDDTYTTVTLASGYSRRIRARYEPIGDGGAVPGILQDMPSIAIVQGIEVTVKRHGAGIKDYEIYLTRGSSTAPATSNKADTSTDWGASDSTITYGGPNDLWGTTWVPSDFWSSQASVLVAAQYNSGTNPVAYVDCITLKIYFRAVKLLPSEDGWIDVYEGVVDRWYNQAEDENVILYISDSQALQRKNGCWFFNSAPSLAGKELIAAMFGIYVFSIYDLDGDANFGIWNGMGSGFSSGDNAGVGAGNTIWTESLYSSPGYFEMPATDLSFINQNAGDNSGYTNLWGWFPFHGGYWGDPLTLYIDSIRKSGGFPVELWVTYTETVDLRLLACAGAGS